MYGMMNGQMDGGWAMGCAVIALLVAIALILGIAALIKYLFSKRG